MVSMSDLTPKGFSDGQYVDRYLLRDELYAEDALTMKGVAILNEFPAADVVEVVRCRECIYWEPASPTRTSGNCNRSFDIPAWDTDFCSYGKRKDGGQDE